jgi:hypothetical protein
VTVAELIAKLQRQPQDAQVRLDVAQTMYAKLANISDVRAVRRANTEWLVVIIETD